MAFTGALTLTAVSIHEQEKRADRVEAAQKRAGNVEAAQRADQARKSRRAQIREARIRQAEIENVAAAGGQTTSSAAVAAQGSLQAQLGSNVGDIATALTFGSAKSKAQQDIFEASRKSKLELGTEAAFQVASFAK